VLQQHHWNRKQAARTLGISYRALLYKIRDAGLPSNRALRLRQAEKNEADKSGNSNSGAAAD
jgi:DNA-binding NtrC family response regulator